MSSKISVLVISGKRERLQMAAMVAVNGNLNLIQISTGRKPNIDTPPIRGMACSGSPFLPEGRHDSGLSFVAQPIALALHRHDMCVM